MFLINYEYLNFVGFHNAITEIKDLGISTHTTHLVKVYLTTTYFLWMADYEQKSETAMGSPLSLVIANLFMEILEEEAMQSDKWKPKCLATICPRHLGDLAT